MRKVIILGTVMLTMCVSLTGCHIKHEWVEATCTEPKTCTIGGETEGEPGYKGGPAGHYAAGDRRL